MMFSKQRLLSFCIREKGAAAVEFALLLPVFATLLFGVGEMFFRYQVSDQFSRQTYAVADLLTQSTNIKHIKGQSDIDSALSAAKFAITGDFTTDEVALEVASIGFRAKDGKPVFLWQVTTDGKKSIDLQEAVGLGEKLETVLAVRFSIDATTPMTYLDTDSKHSMDRTVFFRPRGVRVITLEETLGNRIEAKTNKNWEEKT